MPANKPPGDVKPAGGLTPKLLVKNPRQAHPLAKGGFQKPGGYGFNPNSFSPKPVRNRNIGRGR